jgi:type VI secretion system secreted protein Hcp
MKYRFLLRAAGALALATTLSCHAASDFFLKLEGIDGESVDDRHKGEIEIQSFSWGVSNAGSMASGGGGAGKATFQDMHFMRRLDKASPKLALACATGQHIPSAVLVCRKSGSDGKPVEYYKITMIDILVTGITAGGSSGGDDMPTESISLNFAKIEWEYLPIGADGLPGEPVRTGFDLMLNEPMQ